MKRFLLVGALFGLVLAQSDPIFLDYTECEQDPIPIFRENVLLPFNARLASEASYYTGDHFIISAHTVWLSLASVAESYFSYNLPTDQDLWDSLYFQNAKCIRDQIYQVALSLEAPGAGFSRHRALAIDNNLKIRQEWIDASEPTGILQHLSVVYDDAPFGLVQEYMGIEPKVLLSGHSVFLDRLNWGSLWASAFANEKIALGPFYDKRGEKIAEIEYLRMKAIVNVADIPRYNIRVVELPVGSDGRYSLVLAVGEDASTMIEAVFSRDILSELSPTREPIDVAIPRLTMTSGLNLRSALGNIGLERLFVDKDITSYVSEPSASPMGYLQRVDINITGSLGIREDSSKWLQDPDYFEKFNRFLTFDNHDPDHYHFIANRPFLFALYETNMRVPVFTGVYSYPGTRGQPIFNRNGVEELVYNASL